VPEFLSGGWFIYSNCHNLIIFFGTINGEEATVQRSGEHHEDDPYYHEAERKYPKLKEMHQT
jgi:hypothetical protein